MWKRGADPAPVPKVEVSGYGNRIRAPEKETPEPEKGGRLGSSLTWGGIACLALYTLAFCWPASVVKPSHPFFTVSGTAVIAHAGGKGVMPENTLPAFIRAYGQGVDALELDVHLTVDGKLVVIHDSRVDRTTNGIGPVSSLTLAQLQKLDAGYAMSTDAGKSYPFRGKGITIPSLDEVLDSVTAARFIIEIKPDNPQAALELCNTIEARQLHTRTLVGSFHDRPLEDFRKLCPAVATTMSRAEAAGFWVASNLGLAHLLPLEAEVVTILPNFSGMEIVTHQFVLSAHRQGLKVHVWTINEISQMRELVSLGVDGLVTDFPRRAMVVRGEGKAPGVVMTFASSTREG